jgi:hypothetical protein
METLVAGNVVPARRTRTAQQVRERIIDGSLVTRRKT